MSIRGQLYVAVLAAGVGLLGLAGYWMITPPQAEYRDVAIAGLIYATGYMLAVPRAHRWLSRNPNLVSAGNTDSFPG